MGQTQSEHFMSTVLLMPIKLKQNSRQSFAVVTELQGQSAYGTSYG